MALGPPPATQALDLPLVALAQRPAGNGAPSGGGGGARPQGPGPRGTQRVPVAPPVGLAVDALPPDHETRWIDGVPYFVAGDAYFVWRERERKYQIVEPPAGALAPGLPELLPPVLPSGERPLGP